MNPDQQELIHTKTDDKDFQMDDAMQHPLNDLSTKVLSVHSETIVGTMRNVMS